jgi:hypothetical protein
MVAEGMGDERGVTGLQEVWVVWARGMTGFQKHGWGQRFSRGDSIDEGRGCRRHGGGQWPVM